ncbi:MAG: cbb3-type cytochrome c oxidase subunit I, partial [Haloglomus sp.]
LGGISTFIVGGVTGVFLAAVPYDLVMQDTYYVVGHFHLILVGFIVFALFAALYYYFPLITGREYGRRLARVHFWLTFVGVWFAFGPMLLLGIEGLPRRMAGYPARFELLQWVSSAGMALLGLGGIVLAFNVVQSLRNGDDAGDDPWDLAADGMLTAEWERE